MDDVSQSQPIQNCSPKVEKDANQEIKVTVIKWKKTPAKISGAPNENIVQNHLNIALLFSYLNSRYGHIFIP